jgi:hypothetical protein
MPILRVIYNPYYDFYVCKCSFARNCKLMLKKYFLFVLFLFFSIYIHAIPISAKIDSLTNIFQLKEHITQEKKIISHIKNYFGAIPVDSFIIAKARIHRYFLKYNIANSEAYDFYIESIFHNRLLHTDEAKADLFNAIEIAAKNPDHYLLYTFFSQLAFIQTYEGNAIEAISNFGTARKEASILNDALLQVIIDINMSDIYYRYNFYSQSLYYISQARDVIVTQHLNQPRLENIITYNICENYFRMNASDSLRKYNSQLRSAPNKTYKLYTYIKRTDYYVYLLSHDYANAINLIKSLPGDKMYKYDDLDKQNLADAYFNADKPDSAKYIIEQLLLDKARANHPEIKYHLYEILGQIAEKQNDPKQAAYNFKMALLFSKDNINKLIKVGDISSRMTVDDMENNYLQQEDMYKHERQWLIFAIVIALLIIAVIAMFYRNTKQKRHYEKLLFVTKKQEISFINSHEIRRHLSNILGIIEIMKKSDNKATEYHEAEEHLFYSAEKLDEAIKNISEKPDEDNG